MIAKKKLAIIKNELKFYFDTDQDFFYIFLSLIIQVPSQGFYYSIISKCRKILKFYYLFYLNSVIKRHSLYAVVKIKE